MCDKGALVTVLSLKLSPNSKIILAGDAFKENNLLALSHWTEVLSDLRTWPVTGETCCQWSYFSCFKRSFEYLIKCTDGFVKLEKIVV